MGDADGWERVEKLPDRLWDKLRSFYDQSCTLAASEERYAAPGGPGGTLPKPRTVCVHSSCPANRMMCTQHPLQPWSVQPPHASLSGAASWPALRCSTERSFGCGCFAPRVLCGAHQAREGQRMAHVAAGETGRGSGWRCSVLAHWKAA